MALDLRALTSGPLECRQVDAGEPVDELREDKDAGDDDDAGRDDGRLVDVEEVRQAGQPARRRGGSVGAADAAPLVASEDRGQSRERHREEGHRECQAELKHIFTVWLVKSFESNQRTSSFIGMSLRSYVPSMHLIFDLMVRRGSARIGAWSAV